MDMTKEEQLSVSTQTDKLLKYMEDRFQFFMEKGDFETALAIGDEYLEWFGPDRDKQTYLYYNENEMND